MSWRACRRRAGQPLTGRTFFPHLISGPFSNGLHEAFTFAIIACLAAAGASLMRGGNYRHGEVIAPPEPEQREPQKAGARATA